MSDDAQGEVVFALDAQIQYVKLSPRSGSSETQVIAQGPLRVIHVDGDGDGGVLFFNVGELNIPLLRSEPCLRAGTHDFVVPLPGNLFMGLHFPEDTDTATIDAFALLLRDVTQLREATVDDIVGTAEKPTQDAPPADLSQRVASGISWGGDILARGVVSGAGALGSAITYGGNYLTTHTSARDGPPIQVDPRVQSALESAQRWSGAAVRVSASVVETVVGLTRVLAAEVSEGVARSGIGRQIGESSSASGALTAARRVGGAALLAGNSLLAGLEDAAKLLLHDFGTATSGVVEHFAGEHVGATAAQAAVVVEGVAETTFNVRRMGARALVAATAETALQDDPEPITPALPEPQPEDLD